MDAVGPAGGDHLVPCSSQTCHPPATGGQWESVRMACRRSSTALRALGLLLALWLFESSAQSSGASFPANVFEVIRSQFSYVVPRTTLNMLNANAIMTAFTVGLQNAVERQNMGDILPFLSWQAPASAFPAPGTSALTIGTATSSSSSIRDRLVSYYFPITWRQMTRGMEINVQFVVSFMRD